VQHWQLVFDKATECEDLKALTALIKKAIGYSEDRAWQLIRTAVRDVARNRLSHKKYNVGKSELRQENRELKEEMERMRLELESRS
jgi:hypothetical protein